LSNRRRGLSSLFIFFHENFVWIISFRLIEQKISNPQSRPRSGDHRANTHFLQTLSWRKLSFSVLVFLAVPATVVYAGFFSFFDEIFTKVNMQEPTVNSQNIRLLLASVGPSLASATSSDDVNTVAEIALLSDAGPEGGLADVDDYDSEHGQISAYVVREGDSLASIAKMFDVSVNTILWANSIARGTKITVGQTLAILPVSGVQHTVKKGDTIASISKKYKGDVDEIVSYNGLVEGELLPVGSLVIVPDGEIAVTVVKTKPATSKVRGASGPSYDGYYRAPMASYRKTQGLHGYNGVDLVSHDGIGAYVMASAAGTVIIARQGGYNGGYGNYVVIKHGNGTQTLYGHLKGVAVSAGQYVAQGQLIGYEGNTGRSSGTHLHFEVRGARNPF
jgi:LysM repeat protein